VSQAQSSHLKELSLSGVFQLKANRDKCREYFANNQQVKLTLFVPDYTDDESEEHDDSEEESQEDGESTNTEEEEENEPNAE